MGAEHDDVGGEELVQHRRARGRSGPSSAGARCALRGREVRSGERASGVGQVAIAMSRDGVACRSRSTMAAENLPADGVGAEHAGVEMEEFH